MPIKVRSLSALIYDSCCRRTIKSPGSQYEGLLVAGGLQTGRFLLMSDSKTASELSELRQLPTQQQSRSGDLSSFVRLLCVVLCNQLKLSTIVTRSMDVWKE